MIKLYHLKNSRSQRVIWLLEELNCEYLIVEHDQINSSLKIPKDLKPLKYPTISIQDDDETIFLSETSAICEFLCNNHRKLLPVNSSFTSIANNTFWKNYADASLMPTLVLKQVFKQIVCNTPFLFKPLTSTLKSLFFKAYLNNTLDDQLSRVDHHLRSNVWICGSVFSYVDILMWFPLLAGVTGSRVGSYPNIQRYLYALSQRPAFIDAAKSGKWDLPAFDQYWL